MQQRELQFLRRWRNSGHVRDNYCCLHMQVQGVLVRDTVHCKSLLRILVNPENIHRTPARTLPRRTQILDTSTPDAPRFPDAPQALSISVEQNVQDTLRCHQL